MTDLPKNLRLVYFGTGEFAVAPLQALLASGIKPAAGITAPDAPVGREQKLVPPSAKLVLEGSTIPVFQPEKLDETFLSEFERLKPDVVVLAAYGKIVPKRFLETPKHGFLNIHPSLLPKYRGASPIQAAILDGERETGITLIRMDEKIDHGPTIAQARVKIRPKDTSEGLSARLGEVAGKLVVKTLPDYLSGKLKPVPQDHNAATFTSLITKEDGKLVFSKDARMLERQIRAFIPWPGCWCYLGIGGARKRLKVLEADALPLETMDAETPPFGTVVRIGKRLSVVTGHGLLTLETVQLEGKNPMSAKEFLNGYPQIVGSVLE